MELWDLKLARAPELRVDWLATNRIQIFLQLVLLIIKFKKLVDIFKFKS